MTLPVPHGAGDPLRGIPDDWLELMTMQAGTWPRQVWDDVVLTALMFHGNRVGVTPALLQEALLELADTEQGAKFCPEPMEVVRRAREIMLSRRPALPAPEWPDPNEESRRSLVSWAATASPEKRQRLRETILRLRSAQGGPAKLQVAMDYLGIESPDGQPSTRREG